MTEEMSRAKARVLATWPNAFEMSDGIYVPDGSGKAYLVGEDWKSSAIAPINEMPKPLLSDEDLAYNARLCEGDVALRELQQWRKFGASRLPAEPKVEDAPGQPDGKCLCHLLTGPCDACKAAVPSRFLPSAAKRDRAYVIEAIMRDVAELPNRTSPAGWPEAMLVTAVELASILEDYL